MLGFFCLDCLRTHTKRMIDYGTMENTTSPNQQHEKQQQQPKQGTASSAKPETTKRFTSMEDVYDQKQHFLLRKKKETFDKLVVEILMEQQQQKLSALHLQALNDWFIFAPSITLTLLTGILGILVKSTLVPGERAQTGLALAISVIAVVSVAVQSLNKQLNFGGRAGMHAACSSQLRKLVSTVEVSSREAQYGTILKTLQTGGNQLATSHYVTEDNNDTAASVDGNGSNTHDSNSTPSGDGVQGADDEKGTKAATATSDAAQEDDDEEKKDSTTSITKQFTQSIEGVISATPIGISSAFNLLRSRIEVVNTSSIKDSPKSKVAWEKVKPAMYYHLTEMIISSRGFPIQLPDASDVVEKTMTEFKVLLQGDDQNAAFLLNALLQGAEAIDKYNDTSTTAQKFLGLTTACNMIDV